MPSSERIFDVNTLSLHELDVLELSQEDLANKTKAEVIAAIKRQYKTLALKHHPDKNAGDLRAQQKFQVVAVAKTTLLGALETHESELHEYFNAETIDILPTAFNLVMEEEIDRIYAELRREFSEQKTEDAKQGFAQKYADFFNLAESLESQKEVTQRARLDELERQEREITLPELWLQEWRKLMLTLFGEEYLDDFQYREALATGDLWPVLSNMKLMQPIKWIAALLCSVLLSIHLITQTLLLACDQMLSIWGGVIAMVIFSIFVPSPVFMLVMGASIYQRALLALACPYNLIFRPLEDYFSKYSTVLSSSFAVLTFLALCAAGVAVVAAVVALPAETLLFAACIATNLWGIYQFNALKHAFYTLTESQDWGMSLFMGFAMAMNVLIVTLCSIDLYVSVQRFMLHLPQLPTFLLWSDVFMDCVNNLIVYEGTQKLENYNEFVGKVTEQLPLPKEEVSEEIKSACLSASPRATQSHYFFNTPKDALPKHVEPRQPFVRVLLQVGNHAQTVLGME